MRFRAEALMLRRFRTGTDTGSATEVSSVLRGERMPSRRRSSAIRSSMSDLCRFNPSNPDSRISVSVIAVCAITAIINPTRAIHADQNRESIPLAFPMREAEHLHMTPGAMQHKPTAGALRAASQLQPKSNLLESSAALIDRETGVRELLEILENIVAQAGDLIESRSPELVSQARAAIRHYGDETPERAE
jgi:hypothetical protein